ncbi:MAG: rhodanese-like domain-containing protein [Gammaproteobacteria bacterium]|nr:rhodanese-like domain-containing protein [Gammaproteobacteria bacterium]MBU1656399.1 rhodanese-like domain-containing protein [Gammaproteobacteria bacterium]MBU1960947.1 rhodanese-like domain-containing protein [Gammaproteobacteria bacterium]
MTPIFRGLLLSAALLYLPLPAFAEEPAKPAQAEEGVAAAGDILLEPGKRYLYVTHEGWSVKVERVQDPDYVLHGYFAKTARKCPPFCIQPVSAGPAVKTVEELEVFKFMESDLRRGTGLLVDARTPAWHQKGTIPGSVNIPFTEFERQADDLELDDLFKTLGVKPRGEVSFIDRQLEKWGLTDAAYLTEEWDFTGAKNLIFWCNGPLCGQSPRAISGLLKLGYPADKLAYYRGGMQMWQLFGLTTVQPGQKQ